MSAVLSLLVIAASVYVLAIVTDEFFVVSLDRVADRLDMPSDVAGASLMAMGSSAPELCIALVAVLIGGAHGEVGIGTIVGSAVFNILVITGASAIIAGELVIRDRSIERDSAFYLMSIGALLFVFWDGNIQIWEALLLLMVYVVYLVVLWQWRGKGEPEGESRKVPAPVLKSDNDRPSLIARFNQLLVRIVYVVARDPAKHYVWAMLVSIAIIAGLSYALVEATVILSAAIGIPPVFVSLTLLAAGTSAPDLIASVGVARDGRGSMAVANAIGSNIFDILVGLSIPWLVILLFMGQNVEVATEGLISSVFILAGTVVLLYAFIYTRRRFERWEGSVLLLAYVAYIVYVIVTN